MPETTEWFAHLHRDAVNELKQLRATDFELPPQYKAEGPKTEPPASPGQPGTTGKPDAIPGTVSHPVNGPPHTSHDVLVVMYESFVDSLIVKLDAKLPDPEVIFRGSVIALSKLDNFRHTLINLLEAVKRGDSFQNSLKNMADAGLVESSKAGALINQWPEEQRSSPFLSSRRVGPLLRRILSALRDVGLTLMQIATNAVKAIPKLVKLNPKPSIGWSGPFPTFSLQVDLETDSVSIYEVFTLLKGED